MKGTEMSFAEHWASVYWMLGHYDAAFDYSQVMRVGEDCVIVDGIEFWKAPF